MEETIKEKPKNGPRNKRKRRAANTTDEQYAIYLKEMESDLIFRTNPTAQDDYVLLKWKSLAEKLNCVSMGPKLSAEEWKKRFGDWKYATRSKLRKIEANRYETGEEDIKLTPLEERGLFVWGTVPYANIKPENGGYLSYHSSGYNEVSTPVPPVAENNDSFEIINTDEDNNTLEPQIKTEVPELIEEEENVSEKRNEDEISLEEAAEDDFKTHTDELIVNSSLSESILHFVNVYRTIESEKLKLENKKLQFEIAKYKFENKGFNFDI